MFPYTMQVHGTFGVKLSQYKLTIVRFPDFDIWRWPPDSIRIQIKRERKRTRLSNMSTQNGDLHGK